MSGFLPLIPVVELVTMAVRVFSRNAASRVPRKPSSAFLALPTLFEYFQRRQARGGSMPGNESSRGEEAH
jgi:hypothetical protein